jgi:hypothetical protein
MINNFEKFNESNTFSRIKELAKEYVDSGSFSKDIQNIDKSTLMKTFNEVDKAVKKYKGVENLFKKIKSSSETKNESIVGVTFLAIFGLHFFIKTLISIKRGHDFREYLVKLIAAESNSELLLLRDLFFSISFFIYVIVYTITNNVWSADRYKIDDNIYTGWAFRWKGSNDYEIKDSYGKIYTLKYISFNKFDILYKGEKIGVYNDNILYSNDPNIHICDRGPDKDERFSLINVDLEEFLKVNKLSKEERERVNKQILRNKEVIDSLEKDNIIKRKALYENAALSRKIFKDYKLDYDNLTEENVKLVFANLDPSTVVNTFNMMKDELVRNNNMGYIGLFTDFFLSNAKSLNETAGKNRMINVWCNKVWINGIKPIYDKIISCKDIIGNLRDNDGDIKDVMSFESIESLDDSLERLKVWRKVNTFIKKLPPTQKNLIWKDGYFIDSLKSKSQSIISAIIKIQESESVESSFLKKVSSIKTTQSLIDNIYRVTNSVPWEYEYWLDFLNKNRDVVITWKSPEKQQIICAVFGYTALKKIAYMSNWCIVRDKSYYDSYTSNGNIQYVFYDFSKDSSENDSVIGFTVTTELTQRACHDKNDRGCNLPNEFYVTLDKSVRKNNFLNVLYHAIFKKEYLLLKTSELIKKLDMGLVRVLLWKFKILLNKGAISKFLDFYEGK